MQYWGAEKGGLWEVPGQPVQTNQLRVLKETLSHGRRHLMSNSGLPVKVHMRTRTTKKYTYITHEEEGEAEKVVVAAGGGASRR